MRGLRNTELVLRKDGVKRVHEIEEEMAGTRTIPDIQAQSGGICPMVMLKGEIRATPGGLGGQLEHVDFRARERLGERRGAGCGGLELLDRRCRTQQAEQTLQVLREDGVVATPGVPRRSVHAPDEWRHSAAFVQDEAYEAPA